MFKDYYKFPLKLQYSKVFTDDYQMAFDFVQQFLVKDCFTISDEDKQIIVEILNGTINNKLQDINLLYKDGTIFCEEKEFIWIRGWGYLTGTGGGLGLLPELASKIQDEFGEFIVNKLNGK